MGTLLTSFLALMVTGIPVAIAMAGASLIYILVSGNTPAMVVVHRMISGIDSFPLLAVPFFIFAGNLMNNAGITNRIYDFAVATCGWMKGGLAHVKIGDAVEIELDSSPGQRVPGEISFLADQATFTPEKIESRSDRLGQVYRAKVRILECVERFQPGTEGNVYLVGRARNEVAGAEAGTRK